MKIYFDTNVYIAEALLGRAAATMIEATIAAGWRVYVSPYLLDELERVIVERLGFSRRLAVLSRQRAARRAMLVVPPASRHGVPNDPNDSPILQGAIAAGADYLVTNDRHLLVLNPYEGIEIIPMDRYAQVLRNQGLLPP